MAAPSSPRLKAVGEFGGDLESFLQHVEEFRSYTTMKDRLDTIRRAMHLRTPPAHRTVPAPATSSEPALKTNYEPESEQEHEPETEAEYTLEKEIKNKPNLEPKHGLKYEPKSEPTLEPKHGLKDEPKSEPILEPKHGLKYEPKSEPTLEPTSKPETLQDSFVVRRMVSLRPDLQFSSLEQDTVLHCQDDSVTAPSLLLALLAPWLVDLLQPVRGQEDSTRNILCPDLRADNLRRFLAEIVAMKDEINLGEDIRSLFRLNFTLGRKETSLEGDNEFDIKELPANEDDNATSVEWETNSEEKKADPFKNRKSRNKYEAKLLAKFEKVCKCELEALTDAQKVKHFKVTHDVYEKCHKCHQLYIKLFDEIHVCKIPKKKAKQTDTTECTVCGKKTHSMEFHSTIPATCLKGCGKTIRNQYIARSHQCSNWMEMPCPTCGKVVRGKVARHTKLWHTSDSEKKWKCEYCGKGFIEEKPFTSHINMHLKLKPHKCRRGCELGFADPANRGQHEKRVHRANMENKLQQ